MADGRGNVGIARRGTGKLRAQGGQNFALDRLRADFGARRFFHGINQQRQPTPVAASALPGALPNIEPLTHRLAFSARPQKAAAEKSRVM